MAQNQCSVEIITLGHELAEICRPILQQTFRHGLNVKIKDDATPVTQVDLAVETAVRDFLSQVRKEDGIVGEEFDAYNPDADYVWMVDPILGTKNFIAGNTGFCFVLGCMYKGEPIFGLMDHPITGDRWIGARGFASTLNDCRISVGKQNNSIAPIRVAVTDNGLQNVKVCECIENLEKEGAVILRGGDTTLLGLLSGGWIDAVIDDCQSLQSYLPMIPILSGAGGVILNEDGTEVTLKSKGVVISGERSKIRSDILSCYPTYAEAVEA